MSKIYLFNCYCCFLSYIYIPVKIRSINKSTFEFQNILLALSLLKTYFNTSLRPNSLSKSRRRHKCHTNYKMLPLLNSHLLENLISPSGVGTKYICWTHSPFVHVCTADPSSVVFFFTAVLWRENSLCWKKVQNSPSNGFEKGCTYF